MFTRAELDAASRLVHAHFGPTPQYSWPLLADHTGCDIWVKHENHTPIGAFKVRGGLVYLDWLKRSQPEVKGVITATRGNHGQSIALAARLAGLSCVILVPHGNSVEKNAAMRAFGAELIEHGRDFDEAKDFAARVARERALHFVPSFDRRLVTGVATYALELFTAVDKLDAVYVPIGMGSGICGVMGVRDLLGLKTDVIGVVAEAAPAIALSFEAGRPVPTNAARTFADGLACRDPHADAVAAIREGAREVVRVSENEMAAAVRLYYTATHNLAEGAGAAGLAALVKGSDRGSGRRVAVILSGANIDAAGFSTVLRGGTPEP